MPRRTDGSGPTRPPVAVPMDGTNRGPCNPACTTTLKVWTRQSFPAKTGYSRDWVCVDGYRYINVFVEYTKNNDYDGYVDLNLVFAFKDGKLSANNFLQLEQTANYPQRTTETYVEGNDTWSGGQSKKGSYVVRCPVMGPYCRVVLYNGTPVRRTISCWIYAVS